MASCSYCRSTILFGGVSEGDLRFCNEKCHRKGEVIRLAGSLPEKQLSEMISAVHGGTCPECGGSGPVDAHEVHRIWSLLLMTSWSSNPVVCCRSCGMKKQAGGLIFSLFLGWWGIPWGLIMTPVQAGRNVASMIRPPDPSLPSDDLAQIVRLDVASRVLAEHPDAASS